MSTRRDVPVVGCWVREPSGQEGMVRAHLEEAGEAFVLVAVAAGEEVRLSASSLRSGYQPGWQVQIVAPGAREAPTGTIRAVRTLAGRDQALVQRLEDGRSSWVAFHRLRRVKPVEARLVVGDNGREPDHAERFRLRLLAHAISSWDELTGALGRLDVDPLPHQARLVHRILTSGTLNWLIADDVGLGKTIEVGLLLHALERQGRARRVLIVCPSGLVRQWQDELGAKFARTYEIMGRDFHLHDPAILRLRDRVIVSLDRAKRQYEKACLVEAGGWDVVVFDEAHRLGRDATGVVTERFALAEALRPLTPAMLLLSGTPHQGKTDRFAALLGLIRPERAAEIERLHLHPELIAEMVFRNRKAKVTDVKGELLFHGHDTRRIAVTPSRLSTAFHDALTHYLRRGYRAALHGEGAARGAGLVMTSFRKLAASSPAAILRALQRRLDRLDGDGTRDDEDEDVLEAGQAVDEHRGGSGRPFFAVERELVQALIELAGRLTHDDEKLNRFLEEIVAPLRAGGLKLLVFTEYRATQEHLEVALRARFPDDPAPALIHGGMGLDAKLASVRAFGTTIPVLISTEAGGEGLNLHERCHVLVNYDLPWNPSRIVQRIGRLYRYGQHRRVIVFNLHGEGAFDDSVIGLMLERIESIAHDMASVSPDYGPGLELEILGELLETVDVEAILERSAEAQPERTRAEIEAAIEDARRAVELSAQFLDLAEGFETGPAGATFDIGQEHVHAFVEAMLPRLDFGRPKRLHAGRALAIPIDTRFRRCFPEVGAASEAVFSADRALRRELGEAGVLPLDFESLLFRHLIEAAIGRPFDGLYATRASNASRLLMVWLARYQDERGRAAGEEMIPVTTSEDGASAVLLEASALSRLLLRPAESADATMTVDQRRAGHAAAALAAEAAMRAALAKGVRQPNDLFLLAAAEEVAAD